MTEKECLDIYKNELIQKISESNSIRELNKNIEIVSDEMNSTYMMIEKNSKLLERLSTKEGVYDLYKELLVLAIHKYLMISLYKHTEHLSLDGLTIYKVVYGIVERRLTDKTYKTVNDWIYTFVDKDTSPSSFCEIFDKIDTYIDSTNYLIENDVEDLFDEAKLFIMNDINRITNDIFGFNINRNFIPR